VRFLILVSIFLCSCTSLKYKNPEGAEIEVWSFLSNNRISGNLVAEGNKRTLVVNEFDENQTDGAAKVAGAVVEGVVKAMKP
jgi:hypothetical protein